MADRAGLTGSRSATIREGQHVKLYGIEFPDDEFDIMTIDGQPGVMLNRKGIERACANAPDRERAAQFLAYLDQRHPGQGSSQTV